MELTGPQDIVYLLSTIDSAGLRRVLQDRYKVSATAVGRWFSGETPIKADRLIYALSQAGIALHVAKGPSGEPVEELSVARGLSSAGEAIDARLGAIEERQALWAPSDLKPDDDSPEARVLRTVTPRAVAERLASLEDSARASRLQTEEEIGRIRRENEDLRAKFSAELEILARSVVKLESD